MKNKRLYFLLGAALIIMTFPAIAMIFTSEVHWSLFDFAIAGSLLFSTALGIELIFKKTKPQLSRYILISIVISILALLWIELAVGIFD